jgi:hypothetical protein
VSPATARASPSFTATPELLPRYVEALGLSLRPSFTLKPLHDLDPEKVARVTLPRGVRAIVVVATRWRTPDGARVEARARDVLAAGDLLGAARAGYVDRATIRVAVGDRTVDAFLQLPHRVEIADPSFEPEVRAALVALGLFDPGALPDDARSLAPYTHPDGRICGVLVPLADQPYRLLELLAKSGRVVPTKELGARLSSGSYPEEVARRVKMKLEAQVSERLARAGVVWDSARIVVTEGKKGYRLGVSVRVVE